MPDKIVRFQRSLLKSSRYDGVCIGMVYYGTRLCLMGTLVKLLAVEHRPDGVLLVDLVGLDRFQVIEHSPYTKEEDGARTLATINILPEIHLSEEHLESEAITSPETSPRTSSEYDKDSSSDVIEIGRPFPPVVGCKASTEGLFGPTWFTNIQILHGNMPPISRSAALCWWVAFVLPIQNKDKLRLLKTLPLKSRLALVLTWIDRLEQQWTFRSPSLPVSTEAV
ncbi:hypothetical protein CLU79DRAFT_708481 [Phycomyces nitens]|nr:hypothetical protein CLU79DRAFT_708481 [Phycomyces nitens]